MKIVGTVALVGTLASCALLGVGILGQTGNERNLNSSFSGEQGVNGILNSMTTNLLSKVDPEIDRAFTKYISLHQKSFLTKEEFRARLANFKKSYELMKQHNLDSSQSYKMGLNKFSDWSDQELNSML